MWKILETLYNIRFVLTCFFFFATLILLSISYSEQRRSTEAFLCVQSRPSINIFSVSSLQRVNSHPSPLLRHRDKTFHFPFFFSRELQEEVDNTTTISFYTEDWAQVNSMGLLCRLTNRQDHTAHLWDSGRPLHPIVNMTNEKKYPIKQAFVCAMLQERSICLALSSQ